MRSNLSRYVAFFCSIIVLITTGGVWATWNYATPPPGIITSNASINLNEFYYAPDMPKDEITFLERLNAILNNEYSNDVIPENMSREYLFDTMDKDWTAGENPAVGSFVGSMDPSAESIERINVMFSDCIDFNSSDHISFILKSEDLIGDITDEIAVYSTSDPLTWSVYNWTTTVVGVYLSVFVPVHDAENNIIGYELICDPIHGYCIEVSYTKDDPTPSFSTDHWRDELFYWHENYAEVQPIKGDDRYKYECYHPADGCYAYPDRTLSWYGWIEVETDSSFNGTKGKKASQKLAELLSYKT